MAPDEGIDQPLTHHAAVFIVGLGQHDDILGNTALGIGISAAQIASNLLAQMFHSFFQASFGKRFIAGAGDG